MAQAGGAQREPSMEEILASIRRIIEDSDAGHNAAEAVRPDNDVAPTVMEAPANDVTPAAPVAPPVIATISPALAKQTSASEPTAVTAPVAVVEQRPSIASLPAVEQPALIVEAVAAAPEPAVAAAPEAAPVVAAAPPVAVVAPVAVVPPAASEVEAFRSELRGGQQVVAEMRRAAAERRKPISLSEVQAQVAADQQEARAAAEREYRNQPEKAKPVVEVTAGAAQPLAETTSPRTHEPADWNLGVTPPVKDVVDTQIVERRREEAVSAVLNDISARQATSPVDEKALHQVDLSPGPATLRQAIISDQAGKQIAASFGELSGAFAARSKKSIDDMAEDMLRPMLQDWLDNNLPLLVERLVREEIERVARGG